MWILFNTAGAITKKINNGSGARVSVVGDGFDIIAKFEGIDASNIGSYSASIQVELPDGTLYSTPRAMTRSTNELFVTQPNDGDVSPLVDGQSYAVWKWHPETDTDIPYNGTYKATIRLYDAHQNVYVTGRLDFYVEDAVYGGQVYIEPSVYNVLMALITQKEDKYDIHNIRYYTADPTGNELASLDEGQVIIVNVPNTTKYTVKKVKDTTVGEITTRSLESFLSYDYALDNNVVHKTGDETVGGTKTFTNNIVSSKVKFGTNSEITGSQSVSIQVAGNDNLYDNYYVFGQNNITHKANTDTDIGAKQNGVVTNLFRDAYLSGDVKGSNGNKKYVSMTGDESVSGNKTFTGHAYKGSVSNDNEFITKSVTDALGVRIDNITASGRFLEFWDCTNGHTPTMPTSLPYEYKAGDHYIINKIAGAGGTNYMPTGTSIPAGSTNPPSVAYTGSVEIGVGYDWKYNGQGVWHLEASSQQDISMDRVVGLTSELSNKLGNASPSLTSMGDTNMSVATVGYVNSHSGGAGNLENGTGYDSLKQRNIIYTDLVADLVAKTGYTQEQVVAYLTSIGITGNISSYNYGVGSGLFGFGLTVGSSTDATKGIGSFAFGKGAIFKVANLEASEKADGRIYLINIKSTGQVPELTNYSYQQISAGEADNVEIACNYVEGTDCFNKGGNIVKGRDNSVFGIYNFIGNNVVHNFVVGNQNLCVGSLNLIGGLLNYVASGPNFVYGLKHNVAHPNSFIGGVGNQTAAANQTLFGKYGIVDANKLFGVGNGTDNANRSDAFSVSNDGTVKFGSLTDGTTTKTVTQILNNAAIWGNITGTLNTQSDLWAELQDIRAVAEGKTKSIVIDTTDTSIDTSGAIVYCKSNGTQMTVSETQAYVSGLTNYNTIFELTTDTIDLAASDKYYIFSGIDSVHKMIVLSEEFLGGNGPFKTGDIVLVVKVEVPDRWYSGMGVFSKLESKIDLSNYYAKNASLIPSASGFDIGSASKTFNNLFLTGNISDGTNTTSVAKINNNLADTYSSSSAYAVGDLVIHEGSLYKCNTTISSPGESWTAGHWDATSMGEAMPVTYLTRVSIPGQFDNNQYALPFSNGFMSGNIGIGFYNYNGQYSLMSYIRNYYNQYTSIKLIGAIKGRGKDVESYILFNKSFPTYPTDTTKSYKLTQLQTSGNLDWSEDRETTAVTFVEWE